MPKQQQSDANKLALKLLRQASEVAAILCAADLDSDSKDLRRLRTKYQSARELKDLVKTVIYDKIREVTEDPGRYGIESVDRALQLKDEDSPQFHASQTSNSSEQTRGASTWGSHAFAPSPGDDARKALFSDTYGSLALQHQYGQDPPRMPSPQPPQFGFQNPRGLGMMPHPPAVSPPGNARYAQSHPPPHRPLSPTSPGKFKPPNNR